MTGRQCTTGDDRAAARAVRSAPAPTGGASRLPSPRPVRPPVAWDNDRQPWRRGGARHRPSALFWGVRLLHRRHLHVLPCARRSEIDLPRIRWDHTFWPILLIAIGALAGDLPPARGIEAPLMAVDPEPADRQAGRLAPPDRRAVRRGPGALAVTVARTVAWQHCGGGPRTPLPRASAIAGPRGSRGRSGRITSSRPGAPLRGRRRARSTRARPPAGRQEASSPRVPRRARARSRSSCPCRPGAR